MNPKVKYAFTIASNYLEARHISQDSSSLVNRINFWDKKMPSLSHMQLAAISLVNPPAFISLSDSDIREITQKIFL